MLYNILEYMKNTNKNHCLFLFQLYSQILHFFSHNSYYAQQVINIINSQNIAAPTQLQANKYFNLTTFFK